MGGITMTDEQFVSELQVRGFIDQIGGYPVGSPMRNLYFEPITPVVVDHGAMDRRRTLDLPCYSLFTLEARALLLNVD